MNNPITIYIKPMLMSKRVKLTVRPNYTVDRIRLLAAAELNLPVHMIVLVNECRKLENGRTLIDYCITDGSIIRVALPPPY